MPIASQLELEFARDHSSTIFRCLRQDPPWKVVRGFNLDTGESLVHLNNVSGGIFGGDSLSLCARLQPQSAALITTTGATRIYRPRPEAGDAQLDSSFDLARESTLEYLPDMLIPFRQARVSQRTAYSLAEGATLFCWDTIAPGRSAAGETFDYDRVRIVSEIMVAGRPILLDRLLLEPARWPIRTAARFGHCSYLVTFIAMRAGETAAAILDLEKSLEALLNSEHFQMLGKNSFWAVTSLPAHGVIVRGMLDSAIKTPDLLYKLWSTAKMKLCHRAAIAPRKTY